MATLTSRLKMRKPNPDPATGDFLNVQTDLNENLDKMDDALGFKLCTLGTRPTVPYLGQVIWQTDTGQAFVCTGIGPPGTWTLVTDPSVLTDLITDWVDFSPGLVLHSPITPIALNSGTKVARYKKVGRTIFVAVRVVFGADSTFGGAGRWELRGWPTLLDRAVTNSMLPGHCYDSSPVNQHPAVALLSASGTTAVLRISTRNAAGTLGAVESGFPFTWASGDMLFLQGMYQSAA